MECRDDGHMWRADTCASCEDCPPVYDLTAATEGRYTCEPGTNTYYYDEDLDGNADATSQFSECGYDDCSGEDDDDDDDDEDDWTDGPAGFCDGDEAELGETASREECIDTCNDAGYEAMAWDTISTACYCFIEEWCDCIEEYTAEDEWCWCGEKDGFEPEEMSESECAAAGCEYDSGSEDGGWTECYCDCLLYTSPSPRDSV